MRGLWLGRKKYTSLVAVKLLYVGIGMLIAAVITTQPGDGDRPIIAAFLGLGVIFIGEIINLIAIRKQVVQSRLDNLKTLKATEK